MKTDKIFPADFLERNNALDAVQEGTKSYRFSVLWTLNEQCVLTMLNVRTNPHVGWHQVIDRTIADNDGEIAVDLGNFMQGQPLEIQFGVLAITAIPKLMFAITNVTDNRSFKLFPLITNPNDPNAYISLAPRTGFSHISLIRLS